MAYKKVFLKPGKEDSLRRFHPWVFSGALARVEGEPEEGEVVDVYTSKKEFIACGHYQIGSIAVRVLSFKQETIDADFWKRRLQVAKDLRVALGLIGNPKNNTYRLVHGEGDNLPGLIIDVYDHTAVMQAHSAGMHMDRLAIADALDAVMGDVVQHIYYKSETTLPYKADLVATENGFLKGGSPENVAMENGLLKDFIEAGCVVSTPTCGPCLGGHMGILAAGERAVSTTNRNFVGRMGHPESEVYLASPYVAAASAVTGKISGPKDVL